MGRGRGVEAVASTIMAENITVTVLLHTLRRIHLLDEFTAARRAARACDALKQYFVFSKICINIVTEIFDRYSGKINYPEVQVNSYTSRA